MSQVIINDIPPYTQATAILNQVVFGTNWTANVESDVYVYVTPFGDDPDDSTQILSYPSQYSVSFIGALNEVQVTLVTPSAAGDIVTVTRQTPADRENLYSNTNFTPSMLNNDFGILTLVDQQAQLVNQLIGPRYNYSAVIQDTIDTILPILPANNFWAMNASGTGIISVDIGSIVSGGTVTQINTGLGLTGGPIVSTGTISFGTMNANSVWGNITGATALPTNVPTSYFLVAANNLSDLTNTATARTNLGLAIGVNVEAWSAALDSIASLVTSANQMLYTTGSNTYGLINAAANSVLVTSGISVPSLSQTLPTAVQSNITQLGVQTQALNMNSHQINNVTNPTNAQDAATKAYVDGGGAGGPFLPLIGGTMSGAINMGNNKINSVADPSASQDAVTLSYLTTALGGYLALSGGTMTGQINMGSHKIIGLLDPTNPQDAATKNYVDTFAAGLSVKASCYAASTASLTATYANGAAGIGATLTNSGALIAFAIDGVSPPVNSRILIKDQSSTLQNGVYTLTTVGSGAVAWVLTRATDYDQPSEIQPGNLFIINNGTTNGGSSWVETATVTVIGTDPILFSQFTFSATAVLLKANNLSDVANTTTSFNNISPLSVKGDLIGYSSQNVRLAVGTTNGQILQVASGATTGLAWSTATYPATTTVNQVLYSSSTNVVGGISASAGGVMVTDASSVPQFLATAATGKILQSVLNAIPAWSTPTYPSGSGTAGKILRSDGTNNVYTTSTFADTYGASTLLYSNGANTVTGLATQNSAVLVTNSSGVPAWSGTLTNGQLIIGSTTATPTAATLTAGSGISITNGAGTITIAAATTGLAWSTIAGTTQAAAVNSGYVSNNAGATTITLPATAAVGDEVWVEGLGAGGWILTANSGQTIKIGLTTTTTAGSLASVSSTNNVGVRCIVANTTWRVITTNSNGLTVS